MDTDDVLRQTVRLLNRGIVFEVKRLRKEINELYATVDELKRRQGMFVRYVEDICDLSTSLGRRLGYVKRETIRTISDEEFRSRVKQGIKNSNEKIGRPRVIAYDIETVKRLRQEGLSLREIGLRLGCSSSTLKRRLREKGE